MKWEFDCLVGKVKNERRRGTAWHGTWVCGVISNGARYIPAILRCEDVSGHMRCHAVSSYIEIQLRLIQSDLIWFDLFWFDSIRVCECSGCVAESFSDYLWFVLRLDGLLYMSTHQPTSNQLTTERRWHEIGRNMAGSMLCMSGEGILDDKCFRYTWCYFRYTPYSQWEAFPVYPVFSMVGVSGIPCISDGE